MRGKEMGGGLRRLDNTGGWGGRDRTSEWRNQNPLPYRLATPQLAALETTEDQLTPDSRRYRPSIEGGQPFQQPGKQNPSLAPGLSRPSWKARSCPSPRGPFRGNPRRLAPPSLGLAHAAVEGAPVSWEDGG